MYRRRDNHVVAVFRADKYVWYALPEFACTDHARFHTTPIKLLYFLDKVVVPKQKSLPHIYNMREQPEM